MRYVCFVSHVADSKESKEEVDGVQSNKLIAQADRSILKRKSGKEHVVDHHVLEPDIEILSLFEGNQNMVIRCTLMWLFNRKEDFLPR